LIKILGYELKRLLWNKFYFMLFAIAILYGWYILTGTIIRGIAHTAPFSSWSFGYYLAQIMPVLLIAILFFITFIYSDKEKRIKTLTLATPINTTKYMLTRLAAMGIGYLILCIGVIITGLVFYSRLFQWGEFVTLLLPAVITLLPPMIFIMGFGLTAGRIRCSLIYVVMAILLLYHIVTLPYTIDFIGGGFFSEYPIKLGVMDPAFELPIKFILGRLIYTLIGLLLIIYNCLVKEYADKKIKTA